MDFDAFFEERVANFDHERKVYKEYVDLISPSTNDLHSLEWSNKVADQHAADVQTENEKVDKEIEKLSLEVQNTKEEYNKMKSKQAARIQQISRLTELTYPVQKDVTYLFKDRFKVVQHGNSGEHATVSTGAAAKTMMKSVYKPLKTGEIQKLEKRLNDETGKASSFLQDLILAAREAEEDRYITRVKVGERDTAKLAEARAIYEAVDVSEHRCFVAVAELLKLRLRIITAQRQEVEELEKLQRDKEFFVAKEEKTKEQLLEDMTLMERRVKTELQESTQEFQRQLMELNSKLKALRLKEQKARVKHQEAEVLDEKLNEALTFAKDRYIRLKKRFALEMEGYQREASQLRTRLSQVERLYHALINAAKGAGVDGRERDEQGGRSGKAGRAGKAWSPQQQQQQSEKQAIQEQRRQAREEEELLWRQQQYLPPPPAPSATVGKELTAPTVPTHVFDDKENNGTAPAAMSSGGGGGGGADGGGGRLQGQRRLATIDEQHQLAPPHQLLNLESPVAPSGNGNEILPHNTSHALSSITAGSSSYYTDSGSSSVDINLRPYLSAPPAAVRTGTGTAPAATSSAGAGGRGTGIGTGAGPHQGLRGRRSKGAAAVTAASRAKGARLAARSGALGTTAPGGLQTRTGTEGNRGTRKTAAPAAVAAEKRKGRSSGAGYVVSRNSMTRTTSR